jgi:AcrB/AcrD/AcrF family
VDELGADVNDGQTEVIQRIQQILNTLPRGIKRPFIVRYDLSNIPVALITVSGGHLDERQLYDLAYNIIEPQFERLGGVASASVDGGKVRQITVNLNRDQLYAKGLSILEVVRAVNNANFLLPTGDINVARLDYNLYTNNQFQIVRPMEDIVVRRQRPGDASIHVKDVGSVVDSHQTQTSIVRIDGERHPGRGPSRHYARPVGLHPPGHPEPLARGAAGLPAPGFDVLHARADSDPLRDLRGALATHARRRGERGRGAGVGPAGVASGEAPTAGRGRRDERSIRAGSSRARARS